MDPVSRLQLARDEPPSPIAAGRVIGHARLDQDNNVTL
jgi:hypothetical protein